MTAAKAYAAQSPTLTRLPPSPSSAANPARSDVEIQIDYCGVCHSDLHTARGEWEGSQYPVRARP